MDIWNHGSIFMQISFSKSIHCHECNKNTTREQNLSVRNLYKSSVISSTHRKQTICMWLSGLISQLSSLWLFLYQQHRVLIDFSIFQLNPLYSTPPVQTQTAHRCSWGLSVCMTEEERKCGDQTRAKLIVIIIYLQHDVTPCVLGVVIIYFNQINFTRWWCMSVLFHTVLGCDNIQNHFYYCVFGGGESV